jgi:hypothetical protein
MSTDLNISAGACVFAPFMCPHSPTHSSRCLSVVPPHTINDFNIIYQLASMASMWWRFPGNTNYDPPNHCCRGAYFYLDGGGEFGSLHRFVLAMRHKLNVLDSSIRFGEKMKWSRVFKYQARGLGCNLPIHIRLHGHGGLGMLHSTHVAHTQHARGTHAMSETT